MEKKDRKKDIDKLLSKVNLEQFSENVFFLGKTVECETSESETFNEIIKCIDNLKVHQSQWNAKLPAEFIEIEKDLRQNMEEYPIIQIWLSERRFNQC